MMRMVAGFPVFWLVAHWGRAPDPLGVAVWFTAWWGLYLWGRTGRRHVE